MRKKQTNQVLQFLLALALPLVAIGAGLQSCSDDGPGIYNGWYNNATSVGIHKDNGVFSTYKELKYARIS